MGASRYIGRIGGLAVALGVGAAVFTGYGVAWAAPTSGGESSTSSGSTSNSSGSSAGGTGSGSAKTSAGSSTSTGTSTGSGSTSASTSTGAASAATPGVVVGTGGAKTGSKTSLGIVGADRGLESHPILARRPALGASSDASTDAAPTPTRTTGQTTGSDVTPKHQRSESGRSTSTSAAVTANSSASSAATDNAGPGSTVAANRVVKTPAANTLSVMVPTTAATASTLSSVSSAQSAPVATTAVVPLQPAAPRAATPPANVSTLLASVVNELMNPFAGNTPATPPADLPTAWVLLAAVRRELYGAAVSLAPASPSTVSPTLALTGAAVSVDPTNPITVNPTQLTLTDGIIYGNAHATDPNANPSTGIMLAYNIVSGPSQGGKITFIPAGETVPVPTVAGPGAFTYLPNAAVLTSGTETFSELISETTPFDASLVNIPLVGSLVVQPILLQLYQTPGLNTLLAPLIGYSVIVPWTADPSELNTTGAPIAFTTMVTSFDGTKISTNFYPASGLEKGESAPTILNGPGLATPGNTDPLSQFDGLVPGLAPLRDAGYNVVTWDPRGEFASGGTLQLDSPAFEGKDVSSIITYVLSLPETQDNQRIGMVGDSYGGGIQLVSAAIDPRIDAIVPVIAWNTLTSSLYPNQAFKTAWSTLLVLGLVEAGARIDPQIYSGVLTGGLLGFLTPSQQALLANSGPGSLVSSITAPTLLIQGTVDGLFPLQQAVTNAQLLAANGVPVKMIWFCGGHGVCLDPASPIQDQLILNDTLAWLDQYVMQDGTPADAIPTFQWVDQNGNFFSSDLMPSNPAFQGTPITATNSTGGILPIVPIVGGSGPQTKILQPGSSSVEAALLSLATAAPASNALNLTVSVPAGTQIVGAPELTFTYSGIGTSTTVYAQIVDNQTGLVLGNIVTPIPVTLNGQTQTVSIALGQLADVAYTAAALPGEPPPTLTLQLVGSATPFLNLTQFGVINVSSMTLTLPTVAAGVATPEVVPASEPLTSVA